MKISLSRFAAFSAALVYVAYRMSDSPMLAGPREMTAIAACAVTSVLGVHTTRLGTEIVTASSTMAVTANCMPLMVGAVVVSLVLASRAGARRRLVGVVAVVAVTWLGNVARIAAAIVVNDSWPAALRPLHGGVFALVPAFFGLAAWLVWSRDSDRAAALSYAARGIAVAVALAACTVPLSAAYVRLLQAVTLPIGRAGGLEVMAGPGGPSAWLFAAFALVGVARADAGRKATFLVAVTVAVVLSDILLSLVVAAVGMGVPDAARLHAAYAFALPLVGVLLFARGDTAELWGGRSRTSTGSRVVQATA